MVKVSTIFDDQLDNQLLSQSEIEEKWEDLIVAGPITVNYVGNLMTIASKKDFALVPPTPNYIFTYIKYPQSFRATLVQIANGMYNAFLSAHSNMERIQLDMQQIPNYIKRALQLLTSASPRLIQSLLPQTIDNIKRTATKSVNSANSTLMNFRNLAALLEEVTEIATGTSSSNGDQLLQINNLLSNSTQEQQLLNDQLEEVRKEFEAAREALQKAQKEYYDAFHAIPGRRKRFLGVIGSVVGGIVSVANSIGGVLNAIGCIFSSCGRPDNRPFENAKAKAELALKNLKEAEARYDLWYPQLLAKQNRLTAIIMQMSQLNMDKIDTQTIIDILIKATREIAEIQQQWDKLVRFFSKLSMIPETTQETILFEFISVIESIQLIDGVLDNADREFYVLLLLDTADEIEQGAHLLYTMAKTYYDVSGRYMMDKIAGISGLLVTQTDSERERIMKELAQNTLSTSSIVSRMVLERKELYHQRNKARQDQYMQFIQQLTIEELGSSIGK
jgi:hypothetical protein